MPMKLDPPDPEKWMQSLMDPADAVKVPAPKCIHAKGKCYLCGESMRTMVRVRFKKAKNIPDHLYCVRCHGFYNIFKIFQENRMP